MKISNLRINGIINPVGFHYEGLTCSWMVSDTVSRKQTNAIIEVSDSVGFENILYRKEGLHLYQSGERLEMTVTPRTTYFYRVSVTGDTGDCAVSETAYFETGKMGEKWNAQWISPKKEDTFHPVLTKSFSIEKKLKRARLYVTGVGLFEACINGKKLGDEFLAPYISDYEQEIQVMTFCLDGLLCGSNTIEIFLGKGWYMGKFGLELQRENYGNRMAAIAEIQLEYQDNSTESICTDNSWQYYGSDIENSGIYDGEIINRLLWDRKENSLKQVEVLINPETDEGTVNLKKTNLRDRGSLPVLVKEEIAVKEVINTPSGEIVLDMGQNFAGFIELTADLPKGTRLVLDFGEILQEGNFYNDNYKDAKSQFVYISGGEKEIIAPRFTFFGFRYVRVTGWVGEFNKSYFVGKVLYSDIHRTGYIETANFKINRLYQNTVWGLKSNFIDIPTDCPQRSERLGWTGDAQVFAPTACYHMDTRSFFHKFIKDLMTEQKVLNGGIPNYIPNIGHKDDVGSVWGDIATFLPDTLFKYYGNIHEMEFCYPMMKEWVDYIDRNDLERRYLFDFGFSFGDWLALDGSAPTSFKGGTDDGYIGSVYYCRSAEIVKEMAGRIGKAEDKNHYARLQEKIRHAIFQEYFTPSGRLAIDTQTAYVIALKFGIYIDREKLISQFKLRLQKDCNQIKCGFVGAPLLCTVLAETGLTELAYDFLLKEDFPGWLYSVNMGATTIWERWNSVLPDGRISDTGMNSLNHYAYGSVMEFVYAYAAGIRTKEAGFKKAIIAPRPDIRIPRINCSYESVSGLYICNWSIEKDGMLNIHIEVPFNCEAYIELPEHTDGKMILQAGKFDFSYMPAKDFRKPYCKNTTLGRIAQEQRALAILGKYTPAIAEIAISGDPELCAKSLEDISHMGFLPFDPQKLEAAIEEISQIVVIAKNGLEG